MNPKSKLTLQILEKLGVPLLVAIIENGAKEQGAGGRESADPAQEARIIAGLLARSVKVGLSLSQSLKLKEADADADAVRLALTGLSSSLVAGFYRQTGRAPGDNDINRLITAFEAVLTFADNFTPAADNSLRLEALDPSVFLSDENQINIQYINVFVPVINAVAAYSFGRPEKKLVQDVAGRLVDMASALRSGFADIEEEKDRRRIELQILQGLAAIYVESHETEMRRLMALSEKERSDLAGGADGALSMDAVWKAFEARVAMLNVLAKNIVPAGESASGQGPAPAKAEAPPSPPPPAEQPPQTAAPPPPADSGVAPSAQPVAENNPANYNPMAFFKPRTDEKSTGS